MAARWGIVVGIAAIAGGIAWFALHDGGSPNAAKSSATPDGSGHLTATSSGSGSAAGSAGRDGKIVFDTTARPTSTQPPPSPPSGEKFAAEQRDPDWAPGVEKDIKHRFATGVRAGSLDRVECRREQCLLTMSGTQDELSKAMADLETEGGLLNFADHILLTAPEERDGKMVLKAYAVFDRRKTDETN